MSYIIQNITAFYAGMAAGSAVVLFIWFVTSSNKEK